MSVATANRAIVPAMWPKGLGCVKSGGFDTQVREAWQFIPSTFDEMCDWAVIADDDDRDGTYHSRLKHLVYTADVLRSDGAELCSVTILLQGFVVSASLGTLGNWKGKPIDAQYAMQSLTLGSGGYDAAFQPQIEALENVRQLISLHLGGELNPVVREADRIVLRRPVFTKVHAGHTQAPAIELDDDNDPRRAARKIAEQWRVDHKIETLIRRANGSEMPVASDYVHRGDFVQVAITVRIEILRSRRGSGTRVSFVMHKVVRLWSAQDAKKLLSADDRNASAAPQPAVDGKPARPVRVAPMLVVAPTGAAAGGDTVMSTDKD